MVHTLQVSKLFKIIHSIKRYTRIKLVKTIIAKKITTTSGRVG